jgi:hypothetical protein
MGITELVQSSGWKSFTAKLYGFGASIVMVGALFKIMHWTGAGVALTAGLLTEAVIFFFSAFEPLHEELDWTLVYPIPMRLMTIRNKPLQTGTWGCRNSMNFLSNPRSMRKM